MTPVVFSDIAGTILAGNPWEAVRDHPQYDEARWQRELWRFLPTYLLAKVRIVSDSHFRDAWLRRMASAFTGIEREQIRAMYADVARDYPAYHEDVIDQLRDYQAQGATVILVSGMFVEFGEAFARHIGADGALGSSMAYRDGIATGELGGATCVGTRKVEYIKHYLATHHPDVRMEQCHGYADSYSDRSLLDAVGTATATRPDDKLREIAQSKGWAIIPA